MMDKRQTIYTVVILRRDIKTQAKAKTIHTTVEIEAKLRQEKHDIS